MQRILIANRGEIALRIIRTCHAMGIETVAIFSDADEGLPFTREATIARRVGEPPVLKSYLNEHMILQIAKEEKVDAIHPGYGFLSENAGFARKVTEAGMIFIGPNPETIELMGDKIRSRQTMQEAGVPVVPGSEGGVTTVEEAVRIANSIGYPVMLKASGGGGGIGMVRCENEQALAKQYQSTKSRAKAYFGSEEVFIEKFIDHARHIEVQIVGDTTGKIVHLYERECSIQRRNQKVIEEAPSPNLSDKAREALYKTAIKAAEAVSYVNAGTIEFVVDEAENFYFLEMNTRLQVEHPVTEAITKIDLVRWQIDLAQGENLPLCQDDIQRQGHAIEFRLYAEDPNTFLPSPGKLMTFDWQENLGVRVDEGYAAENQVTPFYDPMVAKCIFHGETRNEALELAREFFETLKIEGLKTNAALFKAVLDEADFIKGQYATNYLSKKKLSVG